MSTNGNGSAVVEFNPATFETTLANMGKSAQGRVDFLKLTKGGEWVVGQDEEALEDGTLIYIDPNGFIWGWQCWADTDLGVQAALLGNEVVPMGQPLPERPAKVPENGRQWTVVNGLSCVLEDGKPLKYSVTSVGGLDLFKELSKQYGAQFRRDRTKMIAVAELQTDSYKHSNKTYGRIYTPVLKIVDWVDRLPDLSPAKPEPEKIAAPVKPAAKKAAKPRAKAA